MNLNGLLNLKPDDFKNVDVSTEEILSWFDICDAYWAHSGNASDPHAELTSGMCSNGFFDCLRVLKYVILVGNLGKSTGTQNQGCYRRSEGRLGNCIPDGRYNIWP